MHKKTQIQPFNQRIQQKLVLLRFVGYFSNQFLSLLTPLIVYKLTNNPAWAAVALLLEWIPKLAMYFVAGPVVEKLGFSKVHFLFEGLRLLSLSALVAAAWLPLSVEALMIVGVAAGISQCTNALSNVVFERSVTIHWSKDQRSLGQTLLLKQDQMGCFAALALGLIIQDLKILTLVALSIQIITFILITFWKNVIHSQAANNRQSNFELTQVVRNIKQVFSNKELTVIALITLGVFTPIATGVSGLAFFLSKIDIHANQEKYRAIALIGKTVVAIALLQFIQNYLKNKSDRVLKSLATGGLLILSIGVLLLSHSNSLMLSAFILAIYVGVLGIINPWLRSTRQKIIELNVKENEKSGVTGVLSAMEPFGFILAAIILMLCTGNMHITAYISASLPLIALVLLNKLSLSIHNRQ